MLLDGKYFTACLLALVLTCTCQSLDEPHQSTKREVSKLINIFVDIRPSFKRNIDTEAKEPHRRDVLEAVVTIDPRDAIKFFLFDDDEEKSQHTQLFADDEETLKSLKLGKKLGKKKSLKFLVHGYMQDWKTAFPQLLKDALLEETEQPVIIVDWGHMAQARSGPTLVRQLPYPIIVKNVPIVAEYITEFIIVLKDLAGLEGYDQYHFIGFGLGAHVSGIVGWSLQNKTQQQLGRITGLDPPGPKFLIMHEEKRLSEDDAEFVDVIHTSYLGYQEPLGHVDFFPNGGKHQPGCVELGYEITDEMASFGTVFSGSCSHSRSWQYYKQSLTDEDIYACKCDENSLFKTAIIECDTECKGKDREEFGERCSKSAKGTYYLEIYLEVEKEDDDEDSIVKL